MDKLFETVIVRPPGKNYSKCISTNPQKKTVSLKLAIKQHREYVKVLRENNINVIELPPLDNYPDGVFIQDTAIIGLKSKIAVISRFGEEKRRGEEISIRKFLEGMNFQIKNIKPPGTLEGGDVLVTDQKIVFIGESQRTNREGINQFAQYFPNFKIIKIPITRIFHLLSGVSYLGNKIMAISPHLVNPKYFESFKLITIPSDESYANNMLHIGDKKVLIPLGYSKTREKLIREGFKPIEVDVSEYWKCDGGITCLNLPLYRPL